MAIENVHTQKQSTPCYLQLKNVLTFLVWGLIAAAFVHCGCTGTMYMQYFYAGGILTLCALALFCIENKKQRSAELIFSKRDPISENPSQPSTLDPSRVTKTFPDALAFENFDNINVETTQLALTSEDVPLYTKWLFNEPLHPKQKEILQETAARMLPSPGNVTPVIMVSERSQEKTADMQRLLSHKIAYVDCGVNQSWAFYDQENEYCVDFANAHHFGGGFKSGGCVQEEMMFWMIPALCHLAFAANQRNHPITIYRPGKSGEFANSFIIPNVRREFDLRKVPYGMALYATQEKLRPLIVDTPDSPPVHIIGLAAKDWRGFSGHIYTYDELLYHFKAAYFAFKAVSDIERRMGKKAIVHTGAWGCGAFLNSEKVMIRLQILAAAAAGVRLELHGVDTDKRQPHYTTAFVEESIKAITSGERTIEEEIVWIMNQQNTDSTWRVKTVDPS